MSMPKRFLTCEKCGRVVQREKTRSRFCSLPCARASRARNACSVDGCTKGPAVSGYCPMHLRRMHVHGDPSVAATVKTAECRGCGVSFTYTRAASAAYCSARCRNTAQYARVPTAPAACIACGTSVLVKAHGSPRRYCEPCRIAISVSGRARTATCRICGDSYRSVNPYHRICTACSRARRHRAIVIRNQRRKALRRGALGPTHTEAEWQALVRKYDGRCAYCRIRPVECRDHVEPVSQHGSDAISNILPACQSCNTRKGTLSLLAWREKFTELYGRAW